MRIILFMLLVIIVSCKKEPNQQELDIELNQLGKENIIKVNNREKNVGSLINKIQDFKFIELKNLENENIIASIDKVVFHNGRFFVLDAKKSNLLVFDRDGYFITKIGVRGNGPGEYRSISDFVINDTTNEIYFLSEQNIGVFVHSLDNYDFIKTLKFNGYFPKKMGLINDKHLVLFTSCSNDSFYDLVFADLNGNKVKEDFKYPENIADIAFQFTGGVSKIGKVNFYTFPTSPYLFKLNDDLSHTLAYRFDLGNNGWNHDERFNLGRFNERLGKMDMSFLQNKNIELNDILTFKYTDRNKIIRGFYDKNSNKVYDDKSFDSDGVIRVFDNTVGVYDNQFISGFNGELYYPLIEYYSDLEELIEGLNKDFHERLSKIDEMDTSHYLLLFKFKANE